MSRSRQHNYTKTSPAELFRSKLQHGLLFSLLAVGLAFGVRVAEAGDSGLSRCEKAEVKGKAAKERGCRVLHTTAGPFDRH